MRPRLGAQVGQFPPPHPPAAAAAPFPRLVLDEGWLDGLQINTIEPSPQSEASRDGRLVLSYPALKAGDRLLVRAARARSAIRAVCVELRNR